MTFTLTKQMKAVALIALALATAASVALITHAATAPAPLFAEPADVPSVFDSAPSPPYALAVERARDLVRAAVLEQKLPGVSVAVAAGGTTAWAEGFGWRDVGTHTPVTPSTRFNIGTAASAVPAAVAPLRLANTGAESAAEWSRTTSASPKRTSRSSRWSVTSFSGRLASRPRAHCRETARRSTSRDLLMIPGEDDG